jgi:hypothetical protein
MTKDEYMLMVSSDAAERIADEILSSNDQILLISIRDQTGKILAVKFRESFGKAFRLSELVDNNLGGTLAVTVLGVVNEIRDVFGQAEAIITVHRGCKLILLPLLSYQLLVGLAVERGVETDDDKVARHIEGLLAEAITK